MSEKKHWCMNCATEQGYVGEISSYIYCERCAAKIYPDGSGSCEGTREGRKREREQIDEYDARQHSNYYDPELGRNPDGAFRKSWPL